MIRNFIWDFDGTLFDTYPVYLQLIERLNQKYGIHESRDQLMSYMKKSMVYLYELYTSKYQQSSQLFEEYEKTADAYELEHLKLFPNAKYICEEIKKYSCQNFLFTHRGSSTFRFMKDAGIDTYFTECVTRENGFKRKPDPEAINYLVNKYDLNPLETMMIGDRDIDVLSGKNAGILTCYCDEDQTRKPDFVNYSFTEIKMIEELIDKG